MMKQTLIKCLSGLVALVYVLSVLGFNVHSCAESGEMFVAPLFEGATCHDFHPEHHCHAECCGHHPGMHECCGGASMSGNACCSDDLFLLSLTGAVRDDSSHVHHHDCKCICGYCPLSVEIGQDAGIVLDREGRLHLREIPLPGSAVDRSVLGIWRL
ncbi:MAG: hypothetical protein NC308_08150 [Clostridium sp.]|nr:hypothetical protein [Bacteroides sp.]MCM1198847.1 hypothetical protein [Clostridium sp.]